MADSPELLERIAVLDRRLVAAVKGIKLLAALSWPASAQEAFLAGWHAKNPRLPDVDYAKSDFARTREELEAIFLAADAGHPLGDYLRGHIGLDVELFTVEIDRVERCTVFGKALDCVGYRGILLLQLFKISHIENSPSAGLRQLACRPAWMERGRSA